MSEPFMLAGLLRHRITIQAPQENRTGSGATKTVYVDYLTDIAASVEPLTARELYAAAQVQSEATVRIRIRYRPGLTSKMRVKWKKASGSPAIYDWFDLDGPPIDLEGRHHELHLMCVLREAEGFRQGAPS